jgi:hypothetical protein
MDDTDTSASRTLESSFLIPSWPDKQNELNQGLLLEMTFPLFVL